jgi:hypothetical protein
MSIQNVTEQMELNDTGMGIRKVSQIVNFGDITDDGGADGTLNLNKQIPAGSFVIGSKVTVKDGFVGDTTAVLSVGTSGDANEYSGNTTHNILAAGRNSVRSAFIGSDSGFVAESADIDVLITVTGNADFTAITAGKMLVEVFYLSTNVELTDGPVNEIMLG